MTVLLNNVDVDTDSSVFLPSGGPAMLIVRATTWGSGTVNFQIDSTNDPSVRWTLFSATATFTANGNLDIPRLPRGCRVRAEFTGSSGANDVFVDLIQ